MLDTTTLQTQITRFFSERLNVDVPSEETDLFDTGVLDSLAFVELLLHLEQHFHVRVSMEELHADHFRTISHIVDFVSARNGFQKRAAA